MTMPFDSTRSHSSSHRSDAPLVLHVFPTFAVGGAQVRFAALANRFKARWRHAVISLDGDEACAERVGEDVPLAMIPPPSKRQRLAPRVWGIHRILQGLRPDVLVTSNWGSMEWALANRLPGRLRHLHTEDGFGPEEANGQLRRRVLTRHWTLRGSTTILPSRRLLRLASDEWRLPRPSLHYVPNGVDLRRFHPKGPIACIAPPGNGPVIGTVAALRPEKALDRLLQAAAILARSGVAFRLVVVGDGPERPRLEKLAAELGLSDQTRFAGAIPDPASAYRAFDIFALSSSTEQMPFSILEAMASGLPVASTDVGDVASMLAPENLPHMAGTEDASLATALRPLIANATLRRVIGAANRRRAEDEFDQEAMFQTYAALIDGTGL